MEECFLIIKIHQKEIISGKIPIGYKKEEKKLVVDEDKKLLLLMLLISI